MSTNETCFVLILSILSQLWSKYDQNSKIKSIKNCFKGPAYGLQDSRKSRPYHTLQSDKLASAKYSNCLPAIANIWFIQLNLSHHLSSKQNFGLMEHQAAMLNLMGQDALISAHQWGSTLQSCWYCWLRGTEVLLQSLRYRSLPAKLLGRLLLSSHLVWVQGSALCQMTHPFLYISSNEVQTQISWLALLLVFCFHYIWNPSLQTSQNTIPNLHVMCWSMEMQCLPLIGEAPVFTQGTQQNLCFFTLTSTPICAPKRKRAR